MQRSMILCVLMLLVAVSCRAQLSRDEKQQILDLHNHYRASVNAAGMMRLVSRNTNWVASRIIKLKSLASYPEVVLVLPMSTFFPCEFKLANPLG